ncbi:acetate--CoA ligase family protein [Gordonia sp. KTR9]|uniref:acetate--CoA ligase family protein n=1 Tax=Gordonia sp. KTR9 TaxID=337191 RepID=UPI00027DDE8C|nr:acetate--CoA ligase family protein [Gordonia sp. KTR9]AFR49447.1 Acyl-CoA synthetase (NDP forming) [Gordonia sp. KTR9]
MSRTPITPDRLRSLFRPQTVALVGASDKSGFSASAYRNLVEFGYSANTFLVNRRGVEVHGRPSVRSCKDIGEDVDVAFLMVPQAATLDAMTEAAEAGISNAVILSSGYGEAGLSGRAAEAVLVQHAEDLGMVLLGPNHLGFANLIDQVPVTPIPNLPRVAGHVGLLSQSGASASAMVDFAHQADADLSYLVTLGNEAMITAGHALDFLVDDDHTKAIAIFLETVRDPVVFAEAARRAAVASKPVVVLKAGSSELSARTAAAHTGALVGDDRTIDAVFRELGVIRVDSIEDMMIVAGTAARTGRLRAPGIGVVSISGGACDIVADRAQDVGATLPALSKDTETALQRIMPDYGTVQNPLDVTGAAVFDPSIFTRAIEAMSADASIGAVAVITGLPWEDTNGPYAGGHMLEAIGAAQSDTPVVVVNQVMQPITDITRTVMTKTGISTAVGGLRQAVVALQRIAWWSQATAAKEEEPAAIPKVDVRGERVGSWSEAAARAVLADAGIPVVPSHLVTSADEAVEVARELAAPVAIKIVSPDILHKTDIGGVRLSILGDNDVAEAFAAVSNAAREVPDAAIEGVFISPMRSAATELLVGVVRDPQWGPILAVAIGGIFVEVLADSALATLPISVDRARALLSSLRGSAIFDGVRGAAPADLDALAAVVADIGNLAYALGDDLESLEVNPLRVDGDTIEALDAVITWRA